MPSSMHRIVAAAVLATGVVLQGCGGGGGGGETTAAPTTAAPQPDISIQILKSGGNAILDASATWVVVGTKGQFGFTEGPVWDTGSGSWIWSDPSTSLQYQYTPGGQITEFRRNTSAALGNILESNGTLLTTEFHSRAVVRVDVETKERTVVASMFNDAKLNGPNDLVVSSTTSALYFTDPSYAGAPPPVGHGQPLEQNGTNVFRLDKAGDAFATEPVLVESELVQPNGIAINSDGTKLYIADSDPGQANIHVYDVAVDGSLNNKALFVTVADGSPDGIKVDAKGNVWAGTGANGDVQVFAEDDGAILAKISVPQGARNIAFGGPDGMDLMITALDSVWIVKTKVKGASSSMAETAVAFI